MPVNFKGIPTRGGTSNQVWGKRTAQSDSPDYGWLTQSGSGGGSGLPVGGTTGQVLAKASDFDADVLWVPPQSGPTGPQGPQGPQGNPGATGTQGIQGIQGPTGQGVPVGGTTGQILAKNSATNYDTLWIPAPSGGGGGAPTGPAGGSLTGTYPDPTLAANSVTGATIQNNAVGDSKLATMPAYTFKGNPNGSVLTPTSMSGTEATAMLDAFTPTLKGLVPPSGGGTTNFLSAAGTWIAPAGGGGGGTGTQSFTYTGAAQTFVVPSGITALLVTLKGASGSTGRYNGTNQTGVVAGLGATVSGQITVTPGETLNIYVGGQPVAATGSNGPITGGFNGGGNGGYAGNQNLGVGGGGGGASDIRRGGTALGNRVVVAGGGGGANTSVGGGGGLNGIVGGGNGGGGGTQTAGGAGGIGNGGATAGTSGQGGTGGAVGTYYCGGGGGGGYFGGGGGGSDDNASWNGHGGGGGSSLLPAVSGTCTDANNGGNGTVSVSWGATSIIAPDILWDTKGDLAVATGPDAASKLAVGTNGQVLTADSTLTTGIKWATPSAGGVTSVDGNTGVVTLTANYEQLMASQTINVTGDSPVTTVVGRRYTANLTSGNIVYNLPATPANNTRVAFSVSQVAASNTATVNCGGSDRFQTPTTGSTSKVLNRVGQVLLVHYHSASAIWLVEEDVQANIVSGYGTAPNTAVQGDVGIDVQIDVQTYNTAGSYTWNKPSWATNSSTVRVWVMGAGGGGGSGRLGASGTIRGGGGGGASANLANQQFMCQDLATPLTVVVGAGGAGGVSVSTADTNGNFGIQGGDSSFGRYLVASGGFGGAGGTSTDGGVGGAAATAKGMYRGVGGGIGGGIAVATVGLTSDMTGSGMASSGGGGGGGFNAANTNVGPAAAGNAAAYTDQNTTNGPPTWGGPSAGPGIGGGNGTAVQFNMGVGGGGGFRGNNANGSAGGAGGVGAGGGGGGGTTNTWVSGAGGQGGGGSVRVITTP